MDEEQIRRRFPYRRWSQLNRPKIAGEQEGAAKLAPLFANPFHVAGNPVSTLPESAIANCFPGLEVDHRNLDRRFFPGLIFEFRDQGGDPSDGAQLVAVDLKDPDLTPGLASQLAQFVAAFDAANRWYLHSLHQGNPAPITMESPKGDPLAGLTVWRLVRSLDEGDVTVVIKRRDGKGSEVSLRGRRRKFVNSEGRLNDAYRPGEMQQSLCSPWQHDFRDCACMYWASNHPDIVLGPTPATLADLEHSPAPEAGEPPISWLRRDRDPDALAKAMRRAEDVRPTEIDHYELNHRWQELNFVLEGREIGSVYLPEQVELAEPFASFRELDEVLQAAAEIELALALEYLFAMYSLNPNPKDQQAERDVAFAKHELFAIAVSEMRHLRWANQIRLVELRHAGVGGDTANPAPVLRAAKKVPCVPSGKKLECDKATKRRPVAMRPISEGVLQDFLDAERPSGTLEGLYARTYSTLRMYPEIGFMSELAGRIIADGVRHYSRFSEIRAILSPYLGEKRRAGAAEIIRPVKIVTENFDQVYKEIAADCRDLKAALERAYQSGDMEDAAAITIARQAMTNLNDHCEHLAEQGIGVPFDIFFA